MKFGIVNIFPPVHAALDKLELAERLDFDTFWVTDSHVIWSECYSELGWLAAHSRDSRLHLGTMVTNPVSRDPIVVASAFATLQEVTGGRMLCGIGRGDSAVRVLKRRPATVAAFEQAAVLIRRLGSGEAVDVDGTEVRIPWAAAPGAPLYVAAYGPRMLELAGRVGDGVIVECADPHYISWALERVRHGAAEAGRDLADFAVISSTTAYISDDLHAAREQVRAHGAVVGNHVAEVLRNLGPTSLPPDLEAFVAERPEYDYHRHVHRDDKQARYVPDDILDRLCIVGTPEQCAERVRELADVGVTHLNFYGQTASYDEQMEIWAAEVIPGLRAELAA